jgi:prepilin-type N-terminal cleavage/methylation domain-containing protein
LVTAVLTMRGMTLIELLVGLAVASLVAVVVTTGLGAMGMAMQKHARMLATRDAAWMALDAMVADLRRAATWRVCSEARECDAREERRSAYRVPMLLAGDVDWLVQDGLRRCMKQCDVFIEGVVAMVVSAEVERRDGTLQRTRFHQHHGTSPRTIEVALTMSDGRIFSRVVHRATR